MNPSFALFYFAGCVVLTYYAWTINDIVFMALNGGAGLLSLLNLYYSWLTFRKGAAPAAKTGKREGQPPKRKGR